jgi:hypothetical protein
MMQTRRPVTVTVVGLAALLMGLSPILVFASDQLSSPKEQTVTSAEAGTKSDPGAKDQVTALKEQMALQQKQIEQLQKALEDQKRLLEQMLKPTPATKQAVTQASNAKQEDLPPVASITPVIPKSLAKPENASTPLAGGVLAAPAASPEKDKAEETSPLQLHIGDATLTPVGFMDFTSVWRNHAAGGSIGTSFGSIPYATNTSGILPYTTNLSEFRLSMQNSRIGFRTDADIVGFHVIGYMEADFLGNNGTNVAVTSNSNTLRSRLYWVDLRKGGWEVLGGQTWSLITPGRVGISPLPADVFYTQDMDVNYQAGLFWGRIPELRFVYHLPSEKAAFAVAIDSPDQYAGGSSGGSSIVLPTALATPYAGELDFGASSGGIATPDVAPDIIAKLALDPYKRVHFEIGGVERNFKVYYPGAVAVTGPPAVAAIPAATYTTEGGGGFANLHVEIFKGFRLMTNNFWSDGGGRYIFGQAPDLVANANGSISLLHSGSTVTGFEFTRKKTLIFAYYGGIYIGRNTVIDTTGKSVGYGYTGSASSQNRTIQELTLGFNQTVWKHPKYGAVNIIGQYSYLTRDPWYVASGEPANASLNMLFFDLRYTLPGSAPTLGRPAR